MGDCSEFFQNYAGAINDFPDETSDLVPSIVLFSAVNCTSTFFPEDGGGGFLSNPYVSGDVVNSAAWGFTALSIFIPFTFKSLTMTGPDGRRASFVGPFFATDLTSVNWQEGEGNLADPPIESITFTDIVQWEQQAMLPQCMSNLEFIGPFALVRYTPQSERCDYFMTNTWCCPDCGNLNTSPCACFRDLPAIEAKSKELGVDLPVTCFGEDCATENSYKTLNMLAIPCNITVCQQTVSTTPGIIDDSTDTVFCAGQFFQANGTISNPTPTISVVNGGPTEADAPFYVWIMFAVSAVLFIILIYLLFAPGKKTGQSKVLQQIQQLTKQKQALAQPVGS